ncbi:pesticin C-terminus-like muramidase [Massilia aquatica]|uniref:Pesticin C-terminal domain-containing protein n=1 Tax=Massilia aquatica TaxID=2609000 RepID=A0ABX0M7X4_9BURK|nr:pesticin C-terminus-like muramidase [Massilia aquatica]NHZ43288.1 hypothetical protein [Massilia aquatica]
MASKKIEQPPSTLARTVDNLPKADRYELDVEIALIAKAKTCQENMEIRKAEIVKLKSQKIELEKRINENKEKKSGSKSKKNRELSQEEIAKIEESEAQRRNDKVTAAEITKKLEIYEGMNKISCRIRHPGCVEMMNASKIIWPKSIGDEINKRNGTNIDFGQLLNLEGGELTQAYIPWWPYMKNGSPVIDAMKNSSGVWEPRLVGDYSGEPSNRSGVTIGVGVDLGQFDEAGFGRIMKKWNTGEHQISVDELQIINEKIKPYFEKIGAEACAFLRRNPLVLSEKETHFLDMVSQNAAVNDTLSKYNAWLKNHKNVNGIAFTELTKEQQTALLSHTYQHGTPKNDMLRAILENDASQIPKIRERDYLFKAMSKD